MPKAPRTPVRRPCQSPGTDTPDDSNSVAPGAVVDALFASATIGVALLDHELRYLRINDVLASVNGVSVADHIGRTSAEVIPLRFPRVTDFQRRVLETGEPVLDVAVTDAAGGRRPRDRTFRASYFPVFGAAERGSGATVDGILVTVVEATALLDAERAARAHDELLRLLAENVDAVLWLSEAETDRMLYVSPGAKRLWGIEPEAVIAGDVRFIDVVHPDDRERVEAVYARLTEVGYDEEHRIVRPDGSIAWIRDRAFPIREPDGVVTRVAGVDIDITDRRRLETELLQAQRLESLGRLAGGIAHDFNNYLTAMNGFGELALLRASRGEVPTAEIREVLEAGRRAAQLTAELLAFGRSRSDHAEPVSLNGIVAELESMVRCIVGEDVQVSLSLEPGLALVHADPGQLEQVVLNLVVNARDAMPAGGALTIATRSVEPPGDDGEGGSWAARRYAELTVTDSGVGMDEETSTRAFEPFFTTKEPGAGTGLGLAVVYGIVRSLDGEVSLASTAGSGTTVSMRLPAASASQRPDDDAAAPLAIDTSGTETVLVVEDEDAVRSLVQRVLETRGYCVLTAASAEAALALSDSHPGTIDLLVTDVVMPDTSGPELAAEVSARRQDVEVLFMSGYSERGRAACRLGPDDELIGKPFTPDELARRVRTLLDGT